MNLRLNIILNLNLMIQIYSWFINDSGVFTWFNLFSESILDPVPIHHKIESPIFYDHHIELDQFHTFERPIDKLASSQFPKIELNEKCDLDSKICDLVQIPE